MHHHAEWPPPFPPRSAHEIEHEVTRIRCYSADRCAVLVVPMLDAPERVQWYLVLLFEVAEHRYGVDLDHAVLEAAA